MFSDGNEENVQQTGMLTNFLIELLSYFYPFFFQETSPLQVLKVVENVGLQLGKLLGDNESFVMETTNIGEEIS